VVTREEPREPVVLERASRDSFAEQVGGFETGLAALLNQRWWRPASGLAVPGLD
jgi:hypothetical protein